MGFESALEGLWVFSSVWAQIGRNCDLGAQTGADPKTIDSCDSKFTKIIEMYHLVKKIEPAEDSGLTSKKVSLTRVL